MQWTAKLKSTEFFIHDNAQPLNQLLNTSNNKGGTHTKLVSLAALRPLPTTRDAFNCAHELCYADTSSIRGWQVLLPMILPILLVFGTSLQQVMPPMRNLWKFSVFHRHAGHCHQNRRSWSVVTTHDTFFH